MQSDLKEKEVAGDGQVPYFINYNREVGMITESTVNEIILEKLNADGCFLVDITIGGDNSIFITIDSKSGISIDYCVELTRYIEERLDRDVEDYSLEVSSAGIGTVLRVIGQYEKNIGNEVEVTLPNGSWQKGILISVDSDVFEIECVEKEKVEGSKKKVEVVKRYRYAYNEVKQVKDIISFK